LFITSWPMVAVEAVLNDRPLKLSISPVLPTDESPTTTSFHAENEAEGFIYNAFLQAMTFLAMAALGKFHNPP